VSDYQFVHFVTHSLGGILVRHHLTEHELPRLGSVVMLAPSNQDSEIIGAFGWLPGFHLLNVPAGDQLDTREGGIHLQPGEVAYPVGVLAGTHGISWILSMALPDPDALRQTLRFIETGHVNRPGK
jgi:triacylglycerol lipase